jgi:hypothetical protein
LSLQNSTYSDMYMNLVMVKKPAMFPPVSAIYFALLLKAPTQSGRILALLISNKYLQMYTELQQDLIFISLHVLGHLNSPTRRAFEPCL